MHKHKHKQDNVFLDMAAPLPAVRLCGQIEIADKASRQKEGLQCSLKDIQISLKADGTVLDILLRSSISAPSK